MNNELKITTDLDENLKLEQEEVIASKGKIVVKKNGKIIKEITNVEKLKIDRNIGISKLIAITEDGKEIDVAYFTKAKEEDFIKFAEAYNNNIFDISPEGEKEREIKGNVGTLKWLWGLVKPYRKTLILGTILSFSATAFSLVPPYLLKILIDSVLLNNSHPIRLFEEIITLLVMSYSFQSLFSSLQSRVLNNLGSRIVNDLRHKLYTHAVKLDPSLIERISPSRILSRLTTDAGNTNWLLVWGMPTLINNLFILVGIGVILFTLNVTLATYILIPIPIILGLIIYYRKKSHRLYHRNWRRSADITSAINDTIPNYFVIKSFVKEKEESDRLHNLLNKLYESNYSINVLNSTIWPLVGFVLTMSTVMIWWVGGLEEMKGIIELGVITAFISYASQFYGPIGNLSNTIPFIQQSITSAERIREVLDTKPTIYSPPNAKKPEMPAEIVFDHVYFGYDPHFPVAKDVSFTIKPGQRVAIVGKSGSGKTTIAKLLLRFYDVNEGKITIGGVDIRQIDLDYLRQKIAYVPQDVILFDTTVGFNVAYGNPNATPKDVIKACKIAQIHDEIVKLPLAYDTVLGERGSYLSGGQRQRLSIARAIIKDPAVIVFDEATSNLDVMSEREVYKTIMNLSKGKTVILVTHNVHEVMNSDKVIVMKNGVIVEEGSPKELLNKKGEFYNMFREQINEEGLGNINIEEDVKIKDTIVTNLSKIKVMKSELKSKVNVIIDGKLYTDLTPKLLFPISSPKVVGFYDEDMNEVAIIEDYTKLDESSKKALEEVISYNNLIFKVKRIKDIKVKGDHLEWVLDTDRGNTVAYTYSRRSIIILDGKVAIVDKYDNIYQIDVKSLDSRSYKLLYETI
ncbi:MAG: DUF1854 domain-containing protein [Sulfolobaceae archaeon]|nr:DUF1854 domain-containing protein [Sulfolobaceae archaeon]